MQNQQESLNNTLNITKIRLHSVISVRYVPLQVLYTYATLKCQWDDGTLSWAPSNYNGITNFLWPQDDVWLPDLVITNSVKDAVGEWSLVRFIKYIVNKHLFLRMIMRKIHFPLRLCCNVYHD